MEADLLSTKLKDMQEQVKLLQYALKGDIKEMKSELDKIQSEMNEMEKDDPRLADLSPHNVPHNVADETQKYDSLKFKRNMLRSTIAELEKIANPPTGIAKLFHKLFP